jgi:hypothetical protein
VAIFHFAVTAVSRSAGRSATAAAAYRAAVKIVEPRTGEVHDYERKKGVASADIVLPDHVSRAWAANREMLWNSAESAEKRKDSCVAREIVVALPAELSSAQRRQLALDFCQAMANREGCAVDVCIHAPDNKEGDNRNHHAHMLRTVRKIEQDGMGAKLDTEKAGRKRSDDLLALRVLWAGFVNGHLQRAGHNTRVTHLSLAAQGITRTPEPHFGPTAIAFERRTGLPSAKRLAHELDVSARLAAAKKEAEEAREIQQSILDLSADLAAAIRAEAAQARDLARNREGFAFVRAALKNAREHQAPAAAVPVPVLTTTTTKSGLAPFTEKIGDLTLGHRAQRAKAAVEAVEAEAAKLKTRTRGPGL